MREILKRYLPVEVIRGIRIFIYKLSWLGYKSKIVRKKVFGEELSIWLGDPIAEKWYNHDIPTLPSFKFIEKKRGSGITLFYLGAHYAVYAIALSKILGSESRIIAVEANSYHVKAAIKNCKLNNCRNVQVVHGAISNIPGRLKFSLGHSVSKGDKSIPTIDVRGYTIDELAEAEGKPDIIILDVEGYELKALTGALRTLESDVTWCVEVHVGCGLEQFGDSLQTVLLFYKNGSYELFMSRDYGQDIVRPFNIKDPLVNGRFHLLAIPSSRKKISF